MLAPAIQMTDYCVLKLLKLPVSASISDRASVGYVQIPGVGCTKHGQTLQQDLGTVECGSMASIAQELTLAQHELQSLHAQYSQLHHMCHDPQAEAISVMRPQSCARPRL